MLVVLGASLVPRERDHVLFTTRRLPVQVANASARSGCWLSKSRSEPDNSLSTYGNEPTQNWPCKRGKSAAPGRSRIFRPQTRKVVHLRCQFAQSTMVWSFVFEDLFARSFAKFSINCRLLNFPEHHAARPNALVQLVIATTWWHHHINRVFEQLYKCNRQVCL